MLNELRDSLGQAWEKIAEEGKLFVDGLAVFHEALHGCLIQVEVPTCINFQDFVGGIVKYMLYEGFTGKVEVGFINVIDPAVSSVVIPPIIRHQIWNGQPRILSRT